MRGMMLLLSLALFAAHGLAQEVVEINEPGPDQFTVPDNVRNITVEVWGGGGGGGSVSRGFFGGAVEAGGGGGGAYAARSFQVTAGQTFDLSIGAGGGGNNAGASTWFDSPSVLLAQGGAGVSQNNSTGEPVEARLAVLAM